MLHAKKCCNSQSQYQDSPDNIQKKKKKDLLNSSGVTEIVELLKCIQKLKQVLKIYDRSFT